MAERAIFSGLALAALTGAAPAGADTVSFAPTGFEQPFAVPAGVQSLQVVAVGGRGGGVFGGFGSRVTGDLSVSPGQVVFVEVGGNGTAAGAGGFNGGASGGVGPGNRGGGGGGSSDVRSVSAAQVGSPASRLIVAGGGGGAGFGVGLVVNSGGEGGAADQAGKPGLNNPGSGGGAGTVAQGGTAGASLGGSPGMAGAFVLGGAGGAAEGCAGGAGGGGYYGGGGGGGGAPECAPQRAGGGGGGASYTLGVANPSIGSDTTGAGAVTITYTTPPAPAVPAVGASAPPTGLAGAPSNRFTFGAIKHNRDGSVTLTLNVPGAGRLSGDDDPAAKASAAATRRRPADLVRRSGASANKAGKVALRLRLTTTAKARLMKRRSLRAAIKVSFTPTGGKAASQTKKLTLKKVTKKK